jgi:hypothetical protein
LHIHRYTYLPGDPITSAGKFHVLKVHWKSNGKEQVEDSCVSLIFTHHLPLFVIPFEGELRKERGSCRWLVSEAYSQEL